MSGIIKRADYGAYRDTKPDTWVAVDGQGRRLPSGVETPNERVLGIFYWTWHGNGVEPQHGPIRDVSRIIELYPDALDHPENPAWGDFGRSHFWGESLFGYYRNDDEYVIRKHAQMLCDAGIDFIAFDASNFGLRKNHAGEYGGYFRRSTEFLFETYLKIRAEGKPTPQCTFIMPFFASDPAVNNPEPRATDNGFCIRQAYEDFYKGGKYDSLWYRIDGKPVMLFDKDNIKDDAEILEYFTFRRDMPDYHKGPSGPDQWPWLENYPQHPFYAAADPNRPEMVSVGIAQNSVQADPEEVPGGWKLGSMSQRDGTGRYIARGRSFHDGEQPQPGERLHRPEAGYNFIEQWRRAFELDPYGVFVTGWNEWQMGRFPNFADYVHPGIFVDQFNHEFSRDIEPMRGGHLDDYYYLLVAMARKFKGARPQPPCAGPLAVAPGDFNAWRSAPHVYYDDIGDAIGRDSTSVTGDAPYVTPAGRNDIIETRVAHDEAYVSFYVRTAEDIKPYALGYGAWMQLLITPNGQDMPGWEGWQFTVNRKLVDSNTSLLEYSVGGWDWKTVCPVELHMEGSELDLRIPRSALNLTDRVALDFKWIDSMNPQEDILQLYTHGDTAPNGRFAYRYYERLAEGGR